MANKSVKSELKTAIEKTAALLALLKKEMAVRTAIKKVDQACKGIMHKNAARKSHS